MALSKQQLAKMLDERDKQRGLDKSSAHTETMHMNQPFPSEPSIKMAGYKPMPGQNQATHMPQLPKLAPASSVLTGPTLPGPSRFPKLRKRLGGF